MKTSTFDWIWTQVEDSIKSIEANFSEDKRNRWNFHLTYGTSTKAVVKAEYDAIRDRLKSRCYSKHIDKKLRRIDHHKIAACLCLALLNKKVFSFCIDDEIPDMMLLSNYDLAYTASLRMLYFHMIDAYEQLGDEDALRFAKTLRKNGRLIPPETAMSHDQYHLGRVKMLAYNDFYHIEFDLLCYADMMFWIEFYNRQCIEGKVDPRPWHD